MTSKIIEVYVYMDGRFACRLDNGYTLAFDLNKEVEIKE
jgi:hypothetical protein